MKGRADSNGSITDLNEQRLDRNRLRANQMVYRPSNRKLAPNSRLTRGNENDLEEDEDSVAKRLKTRGGLNKTIETAVAQKAGPPTKQSKMEDDGKRKVGTKGVGHKLEYGGKQLEEKVGAKRKLRDKTNTQSEGVRTNTAGGRLTRSKMSDLKGTKKMEILDTEEGRLSPRKGQTIGRGGTAIAYNSQADFLDHSADRIRPLGRPMPTQQLSSDITLTFDVDKHERALADYPAILAESSSTPIPSPRTTTSNHQQAKQGQMITTTAATSKQAGMRNRNPKLRTKDEDEVKESKQTKTAKGRPRQPSSASSDDPLRI